jgi:hypothetical protein
MTYFVTQGSEWEKAYTALLVLFFGVWWHFAKYLLLFQLKYDPIVKFFRSDTAELIEGIRSDFSANLWKCPPPKVNKGDA